MKEPDWRKLIQQVRGDRISGASAIAVGCARALIGFAAASRAETAAEVYTAVLDIARQVTGSQPSMAPVVRVLNEALLAVEACAEARPALDRLEQVCNILIDQIEDAGRRINSHAVHILPQSGAIVTLSYSQAVAGALIHAVQQGHNLQVTCLESRPNLEGRRLAALLRDQGLGVIFAVDAALTDALTGADCWLAGADSLTAEGVINKTGTAALASSARRLGVPGYVLCDTMKVWPAQLGSPALAEQDPEEVWEGAPPGIRVRNCYFDLTPWTLIDRVVSENGLLTGSEVEELSRQMEISPALRYLISSASPGRFV